MTPAESPSEAERKRVSVRVAKKAMRLPIPVERPAIMVSPKARIMSW